MVRFPKRSQTFPLWGSTSGTGAREGKNPLAGHVIDLQPLPDWAAPDREKGALKPSSRPGHAPILVRSRPVRRRSYKDPVPSRIWCPSKERIDSNLNETRKEHWRTADIKLSFQHSRRLRQENLKSDTNLANLTSYRDPVAKG